MLAWCDVYCHMRAVQIENLVHTFPTENVDLINYYIQGPTFGGEGGGREKEARGEGKEGDIARER